MALMCGRYASTRSPADLAALFDAEDETDGVLAPDYNVAPTDPAPIVRLTERAAGRVITAARWGLVPAWLDSPRSAARMINARAETVATSPAFGRSFAQRRCLVPADGWYEWVVSGKRRQPYFMTRPDGLVFAGLWTASGADGSRLITFSIITLPATGALSKVHSRMPMVLPPDRYEEWLTATNPSALLQPAPSSYLAHIEIRPVSPAVGNVHNDGPELIRPVSPATGSQSTVEESSGESEPTLF